MADTSLSTDVIPTIAGLDKLAPGDFTLPVLKLVQAQTKAEGADEHIGWWLRTDTGELIKEPVLLILGIAKSRIMFKKPFDGSPPLCRSDNANWPRPEYAGLSINDVVIPEDCNNACPFAKWGPNSERPACDLIDNWAALLPDGSPIIFRLYGSAMKVSIQLKNLARVLVRRKERLYVRFGAKKVEGKGKYYEPMLTVLKDPVPDELLEMAAMFDGLNMAARETTESATPGYADNGHGDPSDDNAPVSSRYDEPF